MKLVWLGHSAFRVEIDAAIILIDPFLRGNPKFKLDFDQDDRRRHAYPAHARPR